MSTATLVPETHELTGDDARIMLKHVGRRRLLSDAFMRLRASDGFSHARSMAFVTSLVIVQGLIALVGLATALGHGRISDAIVRAIEAAAPGPAGQTLTDAVTQAETAGVAHRYLALTVGLIGTLITGTTAMGQLERGLNRLYGMEQDRPTVKKYAHAFRLALTAGALGALAFALVAFGDEIDGSRRGDNTLNDIWRIVSWPLAVVAITVAVTLLFRACPRRRQPTRSWLAFGAGVAVVLWFAVTFALGAFFHFSSSFGDTYGPLAGIVALQLWALFSAVVVLYGGAVAAQLEAVRAGRSIPQDPVKVAASEPAPVPVTTG